MERMKSSGPSIEPWWTPWDRGAVEEVQLLTWMSFSVWGGSDFNQEREEWSG